MSKYEKLYRDGWRYVVVAAYDGPFGDQGAILSRHRSYKAAERSAKRIAPLESRNWIKIQSVEEYA